MGLNDFIQIGSKIKYIRKQKGISQKEMAKILEIPYSTYSNYENNNREPDANTLNKIAKVFKISINQLLGISHYIETLNYFNNKECSIKNKWFELELNLEFWENLQNQLSFVSEKVDAFRNKIENGEKISNSDLEKITLYLKNFSEQT
ncbi:helix-turn-helix domain-containing protein [Clostridium kluyveri]|uniref:helix-turn-helix domain-containing protein n=1 Tax=Clostridium kluyveri TaxID=1534 RepID=UPI0022479FBC|nr:helix-turn-helix transcriptional regulator [Clostridium kluyveri]UZQ49138.1 helix-turn-helix domain-containing protein [Clostridium kluyveri]